MRRARRRRRGPSLLAAVLWSSRPAPLPHRGRPRCSSSHSTPCGRTIGRLATASGRPAPTSTGSLSRPFEAKSIRDERYKLIVGIDEEAVAASGRAVIPEAGTSRQLYDLLRDPGERTDLLSPPVAPDVAARADAMEGELRRLVRAIRGQADHVVLDEDVVERLRALGYIR